MYIGKVFFIERITDLEYILGATVGIIYGGLVGFLKYFFLWRRIVKEDDETITMKMVYIRMIISYTSNFITLIITYFVRDIVPFDFVALAVGTAVSLSLSGKVFSIQKALQKTEM